MLVLHTENGYLFISIYGTFTSNGVFWRLPSLSVGTQKGFQTIKYSKESLKYKTDMGHFQKHV